MTFIWSQFNFTAFVQSDTSFCFYGQQVKSLMSYLKRVVGVVRIFTLLVFYLTVIGLYLKFSTLKWIGWDIVSLFITSVELINPITSDQQWLNISFFADELIIQLLVSGTLVHLWTIPRGLI